jgi:hypothetical protein
MIFEDNKIRLYNLAGHEICEFDNKEYFSYLDIKVLFEEIENIIKPSGRKYYRIMNDIEIIYTNIYDLSNFYKIAYDDKIILNTNLTLLVYLDDNNIIDDYKSQPRKYDEYNDELLIKDIEEKDRDNFVIVALVVAQDGRSLQYASDTLRNNKEIVKLAVAQDYDALIFIGTNLKNNEEDYKEIYKLAIKQNGEILESASDTL